MGIGIGIVLIVIGLIVLFALQGDVPFFTDGTLGIILIVGGVLALVDRSVHAVLARPDQARPGEPLPGTAAAA